MTLRMSTAKYGIGLMVGFMIFAVIITIAISYLDVIVHNKYILPEQSNCYDPKTTNPICLQVFANFGLPVGDQADLPNGYWVMLNFFVYLISGSVMGIWLMFSVVIASIRRRRIDPVKIYFAIVVGTTIAILPLSSWGDFFYYQILNVQFPPNWNWLDHAGLFPTILQFTGNPHVMTSDLYIAMAVGVGIITVLWIPVLIAFATASKKTVVDLL